ncbi:MAG: hypothetical protein ACKVJU_23950 [Verrucomicrobiales bacterium]
MKFSKTFLFTVLATALFAESGFTADGKKTRDEQVIEDREDLKNDDAWIYNDLETAKTAARDAGKPMMIVFRCIP